MMRLIDADALKRKAQKVATEAWKMRVKSSVETILNQFIDWIDAQPTITTEPHWIPVSERLPKKNGVYWVTDSKGDVVRFIFNGSESCMEYWKRCAKAWMPLPEPYKGKEG